MLEPSDDELMRAAGTGDRAAFGRLVARHLRRAGSLAGRIAGNRSDAEEIVQEAFLRAWLKAPSWRARDAGDGASLGLARRTSTPLSSSQYCKPDAPITDPYSRRSSAPEAAQYSKPMAARATTPMIGPAALAKGHPPLPKD